MADPRRRALHPLPIDVRDVARRHVAALYSHLVTRPTGHAVRMAIESRIVEEPGADIPILSLVDLSEVTVLDFSCADEVVAKLLLRFLPPDRPRNAYFVFRGLDEGHVEAIRAVLERREVAAVVESGPGYALLGPVTARERIVWGIVQQAGHAARETLARHLEEGDWPVLDRLCARRLVVRMEERDSYHALPGLLR